MPLLICTIVTIHTAAAIADSPMYFFIKSKLNGIVLDIRGANTAADTPITTFPQKSINNDNQKCEIVFPQ
jgi:hypothetical protein